MQKLDTLAGLKQVYVVWKILCVMPWCNYKKCSKIWLSLIFFFNITYTLGLLVDVILCESLEQGLYNSPFYFGCPVDSAKYFIIYFMRHELWKLKDLFSLLDEHITLEEDKALMRSAIKKVQWIITAYQILIWLLVYSRIIAFLQTRGEIFIIPVEFPFGGIINVSVFKLIVVHFLGFQNVTSDIYAPCFFILLNGHMKILTRRLSKISGKKKNRQFNLDLKACIENHVIILRWIYLLQAN